LVGLFAGQSKKGGLHQQESELWPRAAHIMQSTQSPQHSYTALYRSSWVKVI